MLVRSSGRKSLFDPLWHRDFVFLPRILLSKNKQIREALVYITLMTFFKYVY